jgi:hypothetical protein
MTDYHVECNQFRKALRDRIDALSIRIVPIVVDRRIYQQVGRVSIAMQAIDQCVR